MTKTLTEFGVVGLGRMGGGLALQAMRKNWKVTGFTLDGISAELTQAGLQERKSLGELCQNLKPPRVLFLYIPAGKAVDQLIEQLTPLLEAGDVIVDGGNSYWGDSVSRATRLKAFGINFVDLGTSGGVSGAREGACFMVGGPLAAVQLIEPLLRDLAVTGGYVYTGSTGSGHFTKLVHNGIEFGMLQAIGEGVNLLEKFRGQDQLPIQEILNCWNHGSVIRSWLIQLLGEGWAKTQQGIPAYVEDTGEVNWLISDALHMEVPIPIISLAVMQLFASRDKNQEWAKAIAVMRNGFGGHPFGPNADIRKERVEGRRSDFFIPESETL